MTPSQTGRRGTLSIVAHDRDRRAEGDRARNGGAPALAPGRTSTSGALRGTERPVRSGITTLAVSRPDDAHEVEAERAAAAMVTGAPVSVTAGAVLVARDKNPDQAVPEADPKADEDTLEDRLADTGWDDRFAVIKAEAFELEDAAHLVFRIAKTERGRAVDPVAATFIDDVEAVSSQWKQLSARRHGAARANEVSALGELESGLHRLDAAVLKATMDRSAFDDALADFRARCGSNKESARKLRVIAGLVAPIQAQIELRVHAVNAAKEPIALMAASVEDQKLRMKINTVLSFVGIAMNLDPTGIASTTFDSIMFAMSAAEDPATVDTGLNAVGMFAGILGKIKPVTDKAGGIVGLCSDIAGLAVQVSNDRGELVEKMQRLQTQVEKLRAASSALGAAMNQLAAKTIEAQAIAEQVNKVCTDQEDKVEKF